MVTVADRVKMAWRALFGRRPWETTLPPVSSERPLVVEARYSFDDDREALKRRFPGLANLNHFLGDRPTHLDVLREELRVASEVGQEAEAARARAAAQLSHLLERLRSRSGDEPATTDELAQCVETLLPRL